MDQKTIAVIGGCGHVGLPLGVKIALAGFKTFLIDINEASVAQVNSGKFPFLDKGGDEQLTEALRLGLQATSDISTCARADVVVFVTGTPVDAHLNPRISEVLKVFDAYFEHFKPGTLVIMRSTLFPGTMEHLDSLLRRRGGEIKLAFCPERVAQGYALDEIDTLPQIVSSFDEEGFKGAYDVFSRIAPSIIRLTPLEAEMTKLMANSWRYLEFAIANQFYLIAEKNGIDFYRLFQAVRYDYPRARGYKTPGFAAGPCLFKDTMQLASFYENQFYLGHSAMLINEGLASFAAEKAAQVAGGKLWGKSVAILGLAFKADNDDIRESLSFKVKKGLEFLGAIVLTHDPFVPGPMSLDEVLAKADVVVLGTPHSAYRDLKISQPVVDVWGFWSQPEIEILPGKKA